MAYQRANLTEGQTTFIAGRLQEGGRWHYFPLTLALKTPLPLLMMVLLGVILVSRRGLGPREDTIALTITPVAYFGVSMLSGLNIGHRHLLPVVPYLVLMAAQVIRYRKSPRALRAAGVLVLLWYVGGTTTVFPHYLTYFNELAGGPDGGYRYFADSNVDWGQGFYELKAFLVAQPTAEEKGGLPVRLAAFSSVDPAWYGIDFTPLPPTENAPMTLPSRFAPPPARYIISVVPLEGIWLLDPDTYDWFRHHKPTRRIAHVFNVYDVTSEPAPIRRVVQCADPLAPLDTEDLREGFGQRFDDATVVSSFDCRSAWLYPGSASWLVLNGEVEPSPWVNARLKGTPVAFAQREHWLHPSTKLYDVPSLPPGAQPSHTAVHLAPAPWTPHDVMDAEPASASTLTATGPLTFLGYEIQPSSGSISLSTFWHVTALPHRSLSLMAHLVDTNGSLVAVGDGLGVSIENWQLDDVLVQRHAFEMPADGPGPFYLLTGAYWLDTMERWMMRDSAGQTADSLLIPDIVTAGGRP